MTVLSLLFWSLVVVTALISARWGALVGLIAFVFALLLGAVALSRWAPVGGARGDSVVFERPVMATPVTEGASTPSKR